MTQRQIWFLALRQNGRALTVSKLGPFDASHQNTVLRTLFSLRESERPDCAWLCDSEPSQEEAVDCIKSGRAVGTLKYCVMLCVNSQHAKRTS